MLKCRVGSFRHWTAQLNGSYAFVAVACFPHSEEPFNVKRLYIALYNGTSIAQPPHQSKFCGKGPGEGVFFKKPLLPFPNPIPPPAKIFDLIESLLLGLLML